MFDFSTMVDVLTVVLVGAGGYLLLLLRTGTDAAVRTAAEEAAKATIQQLQWPAELARELQQTRGIERQELRFKSYAALWKQLRPLAIYDPIPINRDAMGELSLKLTEWYFSENGGLLLTPQARDFYFALQDLLRTTSRSPEDWEADRSEESEDTLKRIIRDLLVARKCDGAIGALDYFSARAFQDWEEQAAGLGGQWRTGIKDLAAVWATLDGGQRFATIQQVGSVLRTGLSTDLESRVR
jgi:hypothetical protein